MTDQEIIALFFARSDRAVDALAERYGGLCRSIARGILADERDAEECENDAWLQVWNAIPPARPDHLGAYVGKIVRNLALNRLKHNTRLKRGGVLTELTAELAECLPGGDNVSAAADDTALSCVRAFLEKQDKVSRSLFVRRYFYMESVEALARAFHMKASAVSTKLGRMRERLKQALEQEEIIL